MYPLQIITIGDHLRARRVEQELTQADLSKLLQVTEATITNWENNFTTPETRYIPSIIRFLGYNPLPLSIKVFSARIKYCRQMKGLTHKQMGKLLGVDASTIGSWEKEEHIPKKNIRKRVEYKLKVLIDL